MKQLAAIALAILLMNSCNHDEYEARLLREQQQWEKLTVAIEETRKELEGQYQAVVFPPDEFVQRPVFTYALERFLVHGGHPIVLKGIVDDVTMENQEFYLHVVAFFSKYPACDNRRLLLKIRAAKDAIAPLLNLQYPKQEPDNDCEPLSGPLVYLVVQPKTVAKILETSRREVFGYHPTDDALFEATADLIALRLLPE